MLAWHARSVLDWLLNKHFKENNLQAPLEGRFSQLGQRDFPEGLREEQVFASPVPRDLSGFFLSCISIRNLGGRRGHYNVCTFVVGKPVV